ncbi:conserved membrane hypothetical protein [Candidatus Terasakiella magnetica]|nr:conserved membrane hypothetical protein [Candidatus Terasakiella magnetica]
MILRLALALAALVALWLGARWLSRAQPAAVKKALIGGALALLVVAGLALMITGKLAGLFAVIAGLSPWISRALRLHGVWRTFRRMTGAAPSATADEPGQAPPAAPGTAMTRAQAFEILGLPPSADTDEIKEAYRRLMRANHPDSGGSTWIATRLNQARDVLLG